MAKFKIILNDEQNVRDLLQNAYNLADEQLVQAQNEMDKLANSTKLEQEVMDSKQKYSKAMNDYLSIKDKAISKKIEIAKLLSEIISRVSAGKNNSVGGSATNGKGFDFSEIKKLVDSSLTEDNETTKKIELTKK
jgi:hypothetical protein